MNSDPIDMNSDSQEVTAQEGFPKAGQVFDMVAKTFKGLEPVLADELRALGAEDVKSGRRMVRFRGNLETLYRANMCCRTALRILKPIVEFDACDPEELYSRAKAYDWGQLLSLNSSFSIDSVVSGEEFNHSRYVTYRVKDAIVDWFQDRFGQGKRPRVCLQDADLSINVHISESKVTLSLDSSGESLHKRGWRAAQTDAPINEVLAAGIILKSGWHGQCPFVDPMCGSGTFAIEAAMIAAGIMPGVYRRRFAFESWADFDRDLFESVYNDDSAERPVEHAIVATDVDASAIAVAERNIRAAGLSKYITLKRRDISDWTEAPEPGTPGIVVTNPPYGERLNVEDMDALYAALGKTLKNVFTGYHAWIISLKDAYFTKLGLSPSFKMQVYNGSLDCELREYILFAGDRASFKTSGGSLRSEVREADEKRAAEQAPRPKRDKKRDDRKPYGKRDDRKPFDRKDGKPYGKRDGKRDDGKRDDRSPKNEQRSFVRRKGVLWEAPLKTRKDVKPAGRPDQSGFRPADRRGNDRINRVYGKQPSLPTDAESRIGIRPRRGWRGNSGQSDADNSED